MGCIWSKKWQNKLSKMAGSGAVSGDGGGVTEGETVASPDMYQATDTLTGDLGKDVVTIQDSYMENVVSLHHQIAWCSLEKIH